MAVTKQQKIETLAKISEQIKNATSIGFARTNTVTVAEFDTLRNDLRTIGATYTLAKKTLIKKAVKDTLGIDIEIADMPGQVGMVCSSGDTIAPLSKVNAFIKANEKKEKMFWVASIFEGSLKNTEETQAIAGLPSKETLLGRLVGSMQAPLAGLARWFDAAAKEMEVQGKDTVGKLDAQGSVVATPVKEEEKVAEAKTEEVSVVVETAAETTPESSEEEKTA
jgi:large subunit ribosomal protein L10